jgi:hypothetical protein
MQMFIGIRFYLIAQMNPDDDNKAKVSRGGSIVPLHAR